MKKIFKILYIPLFLLMIASCSDVGIFYALEIEEVVKDKNNLNDNTIFTNMVDTDYDNVASAGYYIGNASKTIYYRKQTSDYSSWSELALPSGFDSDATNPSMVMIDNGSEYDLYISRISKDGGDVISGVYRLTDIQTKLDNGVSSSDWDTMYQKSFDDDEDYDHYTLYTANNLLYINVLSNDDSQDQEDVRQSSKLYVSTSSSPTINTPFTTIAQYSPITDPGFTTEKVLKIDYDGVNYWMIYNNTSNVGQIWSDTAVDFGAGANITTTGDTVADIYIYAANEVIVSLHDDGSDGYLSETTDAGINWSTIDSVDCIYRGFADINTLTANTVIVGTTAGEEVAEGYYQIYMPTPSIDEDDNFSDSSNYSSSYLSDASIIGFLMDENDGRLFCYTENEGVWLNIDENWSLE